EPFFEVRRTLPGTNDATYSAASGVSRIKSIKNGSPPERAHVRYSPINVQYCSCVSTHPTLTMIGAPGTSRRRNDGPPSSLAVMMPSSNCAPYPDCVGQRGNFHMQVSSAM